MSPHRFISVNFQFRLIYRLYPILQLKRLFLYFPHYNTDYLDIIFLVILATVIAATTICTYVDRRYNTEGTLNYYKETANDKSMEFPTLFCCCIVNNDDFLNISQFYEQF